MDPRILGTVALALIGSLYLVLKMLFARAGGGRGTDQASHEDHRRDGGQRRRSHAQEQQAFKYSFHLSVFKYRVPCSHFDLLMIV